MPIVVSLGDGAAMGAVRARVSFGLQLALGPVFVAMWLLVPDYRISDKEAGPRHAPAATSSDGGDGRTHLTPVGIKTPGGSEDLAVGGNLRDRGQKGQLPSQTAKASNISYVH